MSKKIKNNQFLAAELLASGMKAKEVALHVRVTEETISRWKQKSEFNHIVNDFTQKFLNELLEEQIHLFALSLDCIKHVLNDNKIDPIKRSFVALRYINAVRSLNANNAGLKDKLFQQNYNIKI